MPRDQVFISYSHKDIKWREDLEKNLKPYLRAGSIKSWSDKQITPGSKWFGEIKSAMADTKIAVLLVSSDFLASDFIHKHELGPLLKEAEQGGVKILWIPVYASGYKETPLKEYQAVIDPSKPLAGMTMAKRAEAWVKICEEIEKAINPAGQTVSPPEQLPRLRPALAEVCDFLTSSHMGIDSDATQVIVRAGSWAPWREIDKELFTTCLLLFALCETNVFDSGDRQLRGIVKPFLSTLCEKDEYKRERDACFTRNITSVPADGTLSTIAELSRPVKQILKSACKIEGVLGRSRISASSIAAAFLLGSGEFLKRFKNMNFNREPFSVELKDFLTSNGWTSEEG